MYKSLVRPNLFLTIFLAIFTIIFSVLVISLNYQNEQIMSVYDSYLELPFYFQIFFITFIPIFSNYSYLYQFIMLYFIPLVLLYTIYLAKQKNKYNILLPITIRRLKFYQISSKYIHLIIIVLSNYLAISIISGVCYQKFYLNNIIGLINLLISCLALLIFLHNTNKIKAWLLILIIAFYSLITFVINIFIGNSFVYYLSPLNVLLNPNNSLLSLISPTICSLILIISKNIRLIFPKKLSF